MCFRVVALLIVHALFVWDLVLGEQFDKVENFTKETSPTASGIPCFVKGTTAKVANLPQNEQSEVSLENFQNLQSPTAIPRILEEDKRAGRENSAQNLESTFDNTLQSSLQDTAEAVAWQSTQPAQMDSSNNAHFVIASRASGVAIHNQNEDSSNTTILSDSQVSLEKPTPKPNHDQTNKEKELYFLRAQYYHHLKSQARALENRTRNGAFIGVVLGASNMDITLQRLGKPYAASINPFVLGASGGYMHFIGAAPMGIRIYGQYLAAWNSSNNIQDSITMQLFSFNLDVFGDLAITDDGYYLGAYAGVGGGLAIFDQRLENIYKQHQIIVGSVLNFGLSATLAHHHRLEAGVKIPPSVVNENFAFRLMYLVSYQYLF